MSKAKSGRRCYECGRFTGSEDTLCQKCQELKEQKDKKREEDYRAAGWNMALYHARRAKGMSRRELAKLAGVAESTYGKCESGQGDLTEANRARVARVLGVPVTMLWTEPYKVRCRSCLTWFAPVKNEYVCPGVPGERQAGSQRVPEAGVGQQPEEDRHDRQDGPKARHDLWRVCGAGKDGEPWTEKRLMKYLKNTESG